MSPSSSVRLVLLPVLHTKHSSLFCVCVVTSALVDSGRDRTTHVKPHSAPLYAAYHAWEEFRAPESEERLTQRFVEILFHED